MTCPFIPTILPLIALYLTDLRQEWKRRRAEERKVKGTGRGKRWAEVGV